MLPVAVLFGTRYLATLFGLTLRSHQLGDATISRLGDDQWMWIAYMALALLAARINLLICEARILRTAAACPDRVGDSNENADTISTLRILPFESITPCRVVLGLHI